MSKPGSFSADDHAHMARALRLAARGRYTTHPNPRVGCVLVAGGQVVGEGWHRVAGGPHAEIEALDAAGARAAGATAYVTLEPCSHHGRTPPCADAMVAARVARVVAAVTDPNPMVGGRGLATLEAAGVEVASGLLESAAAELNAGFLCRMARGRPRVTLKLAASLDGRTAMASGESRWITGPAARADVQRLRAASSAVLTGIGTVLADDPSLTVRAEGLDTLGRQPLRVVLDSGLRMSPAARMLALPGSTLVFAAGRRAAASGLEAAGATVEYLPAADDGLDLAAVLHRLGALECNDVLVEAGPTLAGSLMAAGLVDEIVLYLAPHLMGDTARGLFSLPGLEKMADRVQLRITDLRRVGDDLRLRAVLAPRDR
jgi:diaminohydroxyphosphoribosylaminopyrimidine deaminase/5-amino-6-(5-phosphoribosylamino)uracil reductase